MKQIGQQLRQLRLKRKMTQQDLADHIGRIQSEIYRWEKGIVRIPAEELPALASALDCTIDDFFVHQEPAPIT